MILKENHDLFLRKLFLDITKLSKQLDGTKSGTGELLLS